MKYLIDTHTLIWALTEPNKLSQRVRDILGSPYIQIVVSAVSFWEISMKYAKGKLILSGITPQDIFHASRQMGIEFLPLSAEVCASYHQFNASYHKDPFDKMLLWIAKSENFPFISNDQYVKLYQTEGILVVW